MFIQFPPMASVKGSFRSVLKKFTVCLMCSAFGALPIMAQDLTISVFGDQGSTSGTNWSISGNTLTVGSSGSATVHPNVITNHLTNTGDLTVVLPHQTLQARNCNIIANIFYTGSTPRTLTFSIANNITVASTVSVASTSSAMNLVLNARNQTTNIPDNGRVVLDGVTINTNGGHFWAGGGTLTSSWNGLTVGNSGAGIWVDDLAAISLSGSTLSTAGGNIYMFGSSIDQVDDDDYNYGVQIASSSITSQTGSIQIQGTLNGRYTYGVGLDISSVASSTTISATTGAISLYGSGLDMTTNGNGFRIGARINSTSVANNISISTTTGAIAIEGTAGFTATVNDKEGLAIGGTGLGVTSRSGNITLRGTNTLESSGQYANSIRFSNPDVTNAIRIGYDGTNAYSGDILIEGNSIYQRLKNAGTGSISIQSTGTLNIQPTGSSFTYMRADNSGTLTYDDDWNFGST